MCLSLDCQYSRKFSLCFTLHLNNHFTHAYTLMYVVHTQMNMQTYTRTYLAIVVYLHKLAKPAAVVVPHCLSITK